LSLNQASEALTRHAYRQVVRQFLFVPVRGRDDCAFRPSTCHFLIKERADRLRAAKLRLRNIDISGFNSDRRNEAAMRVDHLVHKAGLTQGDASEIEVATQNSGGHDAKADCRDLRRESELGSVNIEKVAQLAKLYATGALPDKELRAIKERANVAGNEVADKDNGAHLVPNDWGTASGQTRDPEAGGGAFNQRIEMAREKADFSAGLRAMESSIRVFFRPSGFRSDQSVSDKARRSRSLALFFIAALIAVGATFAWHSQGDEAKEMVRRRWALSLDWLLSMSTTKSPPAPVAASTSPELARPLEAVAPDPVGASHTAEQPAAEQRQMYPDVATAKGVEQNIRSKTSSPPLHSRSKRTPVPETRPTTIEGWMLREVTSGTAVLEGPNGIWKVKRGDTVPGVGRVESIVLWGKRWIVATSRGLISTP
jgi:hypothetical protein